MNIPCNISTDGEKVLRVDDIEIITRNTGFCDCDGKQIFTFDQLIFKDDKKVLQLPWDCSFDPFSGNFCIQRVEEDTTAKKIFEPVPVIARVYRKDTVRIPLSENLAPLLKIVGNILQPYARSQYLQARIANGLNCGNRFSFNNPSRDPQLACDED